MRYIPLLNSSEVCIVDDSDYKVLSSYNWRLSNMGYAVRSSWNNKKYKSILMHRVVASTPKGMVTDHINHNKLDNRKSNLRVTTQLLNTNHLKKKTRGVYWHKASGRWRAVIRKDKVNCHLGLFSSKASAIKAYEEEWKIKKKELGL